LCKLKSSCWIVAMVLGDQEVFLFQLNHDEC
jgi:hypothetical protein